MTSAREPADTFLLADTHCHLDFNVFNSDREVVLADARRNGVAWILNPGIDVFTSAAIVEMAQHLEGVYAAVGVHPNDATSWNDEAVPRLVELAGSPKVVAIGEIGLDYYRDRAPKEQQRLVFTNQLGVAQALSLPVIVHTRQSISETLDILSDWIEALKVYNHPLSVRPGVLHSFSGNVQEAEKAIDLGFFIGITGPVTFKNAPELQKLVACLPIERLLIETDAPFLAPHPNRGQRNRPEWVRLIAQKIAELQKINLEDAAKITTANALRLFAWRDLG